MNKTQQLLQATQIIIEQNPKILQNKDIQQVLKQWQQSANNDSQAEKMIYVTYKNKVYCDLFANELKKQDQQILQEFMKSIFTDTDFQQYIFDLNDLQRLFTIYSDSLLLQYYSNVEQYVEQLKDFILNSFQVDKINVDCWSKRLKQEGMVKLNQIKQFEKGAFLMPQLSEQYLDMMKCIQPGQTSKFNLVVNDKTRNTQRVRTINLLLNSAFQKISEQQQSKQQQDLTIDLYEKLKDQLLSIQATEYQQTWDQLQKIVIPYITNVLKFYEQTADTDYWMWYISHKLQLLLKINMKGDKSFSKILEDNIDVQQEFIITFPQYIIKKQ